MKDQAKELGVHIRSLRKERSLTQDQLAERAEIHPKYLSSLERGLENPTFEVLQKLSKGLGISIWRLVITEHESADEKELRKKAHGLIDTAQGEKLRTVVKLVHAIME